MIDQDLDALELQKRLPIVRQALRVAQSNARERGRLPGLCLPKKVEIPSEKKSNAHYYSHVGYWVHFTNL